MGSFTARERQALMPLVADTVNYGLSEPEAMAYIKARLGKEISTHTYYRRKKEVDSGQYANEWMSYYSRVGFLVKHKQIIEVMDTIQQDVMKDYLIEQSKPYESRNPDLIIKYRSEIRDNAKLLQELSLGTPIIAQIKAKLEKVENAQVLQSGK